MAEQTLAVPPARPAALRVIASRLLGWRYVLVVLLAFGLAGLFTPYFFTATNIFNVLRQASVLALASLGMTLVMLTGGVDLSVGSIVAVAAVTAAAAQPLGLWPALLLPLLVGAFLGLVNGVLVSKLKIYPFVATLSTMAIFNGLALIYTGGQYITGVRPEFRPIGTGYVWIVPTPVVIAALAFALAIFVLRATPYGRNIYAVGGNKEAARLSGIAVGFYEVSVYVLSGLLCTLGALILVARTTVGDPIAGEGMSLDALAATVIGGTTFSGGVGGAAHTVAGVLILGVINNMLNLHNVSPYTQYVFKGAIILGAVFVNEYRARRRGVDA